MKIHHLTVPEALASLQSRPEGLATDEARRRLDEFGYNEVEGVGREPLLLRFVKGFTHFFAVILWVAAILAFFAEWREPGQGMATLGWAILGVIAINGAFSFWQEYRAERALQSLQALLPREARTLRDGLMVPLPVRDLVPGDVIVLEEGDDVPADCRLLEAFGVRVNNATVTGESVPHSRNAEPHDGCDFPESRNVLLAGTSLVSGQARALVFATGAHTVFGNIAHLTQAAPEALSPLQKEIVRVSRFVAALALGLGVSFYFIGQAMGLSFWQNFIFAIGIIVANVPEGLLPTVTLALAMGSQRMARRNALIRHLPAVETLGCATVICTDKTGTLTCNRMTVAQCFMAGRMFSVPEIAAAPGHEAFLEVARLCHDVKRTRRNHHEELTGDPMEIALVRLAEEVAPSDENAERLGEIPFDSQRKRLTTLHRTREGNRISTKGAVETVLPLCVAMQTADGVLPLTAEMKQEVLRAQESMGTRGLRVLAFAHRRAAAGDCDPANLEEKLILLGLVGLQDPPRPEVPDAIRRCHEAGIRVIMVTGDHPHTARAIAREIRLAQDPVVITGDDLQRLSNTQLQLALEAPEILFARVAAEQKLRIVSALKRKGHVVAVTGDGVNDAPALKHADIGIAMGLSGTDVAREAADMVLLDDNFASIVAAVEEGRAVFANIRKFLTYILTSNIPEVVPYLAFVLLKIPLPLTIVQILAVDLGTDMLPALGLGAEKPHPHLMRQPPRSRNVRLLNWPLLARAYGFLGVMEAIAAMAAFFFVLNQGGWHHGMVLSPQDPLYLRATTGCLAAIVVMQVVNVFLCRSGRDSAFAPGIWGNKILLVGLVVEAAAILFITYTPWGNALFGCAPLAASVWLFILPFALGMLAIEETRKAWVRRKG